MGVHAAAILSENRLGHERRRKTERPGDVLHHEPERRDVVRCLQRFGISEIDLVLPERDLVVRRFHLEPHQLEDVNDRAARILAEIGRGEIKIRSYVVRDR